jgi:hypothetical protein
MDAPAAGCENYDYRKSTRRLTNQSVSQSSARYKTHHQPLLDRTYAETTLFILPDYYCGIAYLPVHDVIQHNVHC